MSLLTLFKSLFTKKQECNCKKMHLCDHYITLNRRGYDIIVPQYVYDELVDKGYTIGLTLTGKEEKRPSCVQLSHTVNGKQQYVGTLKSYMHVKAFNDGNVCNFNYNNIVKE